MNEYKALHETFFGDIVKSLKPGNGSNPLDVILSKFTDTFTRNPTKARFSSSSLAKLTSGLILVFPVMVSRSLSINTANMIAKAVERKGVTMVQMLFSAYQVEDEEGVNNVIAYLNRFHKNIKMKDPLHFTVDDMITALDIVTEGTNVTVDREQVKLIREDMKNIFFYFEKNVNPVSLNEYSVSRGIGKSFTLIRENADDDIDDEDDLIERDVIIRDRVRRARENEPTRCRYGSLTTRSLKDLQDIDRNRLIDTDVKKANELLPSMLAVNFIMRGKSGTPVTITGAVIGVKARIIPVESNDIIAHLQTKVVDSRFLFNLFRATTREISFAKDFLFAIDNAKLEAISNSKRGSSSPLWKVLERRAITSRIRRMTNKNNETMAITTLVISQDEIDEIKKIGNIDFEDFKNISVLFDKYNLICFCIADENLEVTKFLFDTGEAMWETLPFRALERDNANEDYRKVINLLTKSR